MEELQVLAMLIEHADQQISSHVNMFLVIMGVLATFTMTDAYEKKFNIVLKVIMSILLTIILFYNRDAVINQMLIYNALIDSFPDGIEPWKTLFADHSVYHAIDMGAFRFAHAALSIFINLFIWHKELSLKVGAPLKIWFRNWKTKRRRKA